MVYVSTNSIGVYTTLMFNLIMSTKTIDWRSSENSCSKSNFSLNKRKFETVKMLYGIFESFFVF